MTSTSSGRAPPRDPPALVAALDRLIDDDALRASMARRARSRAQQYGWPQIAQRVLGLLCSLPQRAAPGQDGIRRRDFVAARAS